MGEELSEPCASIVFMVNLVYDRGVALEYDLVHDRLEDAERRLADLEDMMPQVYGLTELTTVEERTDLVRSLGKVRRYVQIEGNTVMGQGAADEFNASFRTIMWSIIVRCRERVKPEVIQLGGEVTETPPGRPSPQTYYDWLSLGMDIKERYPDDPVMRATVNHSLHQILMAEERAEGWSAEGAEEAKRWLVEKAGELGIR